MADGARGRRNGQMLGKRSHPGAGVTASESKDALPGFAEYPIRKLPKRSLLYFSHPVLRSRGGVASSQAQEEDPDPELETLPNIRSDEEWCRTFSQLEEAIAWKSSSKTSLTDGGNGVFRIFEYQLETQLRVLELPSPDAETNGSMMQLEESESEEEEEEEKQPPRFLKLRDDGKDHLPRQASPPEQPGVRLTKMPRDWAIGVDPEALKNWLRSEGLDGWTQDGKVYLLDSTILERCSLIDADRKPGRVQLFIKDMFSNLRI